MKINQPILIRVLAILVCIVMLAGVMTACFSNEEFVPSTPTTENGGNDNSGTTNEDGSFTASTTLSDGSLIYGALANSVTVGTTEGYNAIIPADVKIAEGASSVSLSVKPVETGSEIELGAGETSQSLDVHIDGVALDNTVPMIVNLGAVLEAGLNATSLKFYHTENGTPVLMTRVNSLSDFAIHNQYYYNAETGEVSIYVASFSVITAVNANVDVWDGTSDTTWYNESDNEFTLDSAEALAGFRDLVDGGNTFAGKTVKLGVDIDLNKVLFNPIGGGWAYNGGKTFNGTFDGQGHTIYNIRVNGWELDSTDKHSGTSMGAGLFSSIHNATIKNLAVVGADLVVETTSIGIIAGVAQGKCTFENIVVSNATLGNYQMRNGGIVGDIYVIESDNVSEGEYSHIFKNIVVDSSVKLSSMWGDFDTGNGGVVGGKYGSAKVLMQNVTVAAELDVFSDVTAAYQWYAYRRCGMLIGYTGQNSPKQATNAAADFLTCENVNVYYGDWTNYTYYQFNEQDNATGRRYPWVRAEASPYNNAFSNVRYGVPTFDGVKVSDMDANTLNDKKSDFAAITFDQLYGGGQGVYGTADHKQGGVNRSYSLPKTFYINNNLGWTNLKLSYKYQNGEDTWTTIVDGIELFESNGVYRVDLPVGATSFTITADGGYTSKEFIVAELTEKETYLVHEHNFSDTNECECGAVKITTTVKILDYANANSWVNGTQYPTINMGGGITVATNDKGNNGKYYTSGNDWRLYQTDDGIIVINSTSGNIVSIKLTYASSNNGILDLNGSDVESGTVIDVNSNSITFSVGNTGSATNGQVRITAIEVVYIIENHECNQKEEIKGKDATCTEDGLTDGAKCDVCGTITKEQETISKLDHNWKDATCQAPKTCLACGETEGEALGHTTENGTCERCHKEIGGTVEPDVPAKETGWIKTDIADIEKDDVVVIVWTTANGTGTSYAMSNDKGTGSAPAAVTVTIAGNKLDGDIADNIKWNIVYDNGNLTIYPNGTTATWLYCTSTNNGVRVGTNTNKTFIVDATTGYLKHEETGRYLGIYNAQDVRCYTTHTSNNKDQTIAFYVYYDSASSGETPNPDVPTCQHTNRTEATTASCTAGGITTVTCKDCGETVSTATVEALGHTTENGTCERCGEEIGGTSGGTETPKEPTVVLEITKDDFNSTSYAANNNTKTKNGYSYTSYQVMNQNSTMQWQKSKGYITIASNDFIKLEIKVTAATYTVTVGGKTVSGSTSNGVTTYDLTGLTGEVKIAVGSATGKVDYLKFYK